MYKYTKKAILSNFIFVAMLLFLLIFIQMDVMYRIVIGLVALMITRDALKEKNANFELTGDKLIITNKGTIVKEVPYKSMRFLTITRKNKHWVVIADEEKVLFTIKPKIERYENMISELIVLNQSNKKLEVHDYIKKTYKK